jgi:WD40 repeat protein
VSHVDGRGLVAIVGLGIGAGVVWSALMPFDTNLAVTGPAATAAYYVLLALAVVGAPAGAGFVATRRLGGLGSAGTINPIMVTAATGAVAAVTSLAGGAALMWALPWLPDSALLDTGPLYRPPDMVEHVIPSYVGVLITAPAVAALAGWMVDRTRRRRLAGVSLLGLALLTWPLLSHVDSDSTAFGRVGTTNVVFSPAGGTLLTANADYTWILWNISDPARPIRLATFNDQVLYSPDGSLLASRNVLWSLRDPGRPARLTLFRAGEPVAFSADGGTLATHNASDMMTDPIHPVQLARFAAAEQALFGPDGRTLLILDDGASVATVWSLADLTHPAQEATIPDAGDWTLSPDGRTLVLAQWESPIRAWDVSDPAHPRPIGALPADSEGKVSFSPDSRTLTSSRSDGTIRLWNARDLSPLATLPPPSEPTPQQIGASDTLTTVAFSADGHTLASVTGNTTESRWAITDPTHPVRLSTVTRETNGAGVVRFSPDLSTVAGAAIDGSNSITLWRVA